METRNAKIPENAESVNQGYVWSKRLLALLRIVTILVVIGFVCARLMFGADLSPKQLLVGTITGVGFFVIIWCWRILRNILSLVWSILIGLLVLGLLFH